MEPRGWPKPQSNKTAQEDQQRRRFAVRDRRPDVEAPAPMASALGQEYGPPPKRVNLSGGSPKDCVRRQSFPPRPRVCGAGKESPACGEVGLQNNQEMRRPESLAVRTVV
jgi:hypothetical protein